jgi:DNA-binding transcriptional LysR family regulator
MARLGQAPPNPCECRTMQLRQLEYLVALAREGHFARAAAACWVSQPTLSDGIRTLETELGVAIVRRGQRYQGLTPEGERLLDFARRLLHERDELLREFGPRSEGLSGRLRIGAIPTSLPPLPLVTTPFRDRHPGVDLTVLSLSSAEIDRQLKTFDLDVGLTYLDGDPLGSVRTLALYEERYLLLVSNDVLPEERGPIDWADASELPLCLLTRDMQNRRIVDRLFRLAGVAPSPRIETNSISTLLSHVRSGRCASVIPQTWLQPFGTPDGTRLVPFTGHESASRIGLVWLDSDPEPLLTRAFLEVSRGLELQATLDSVLGGLRGAGAESSSAT